MSPTFQKTVIKWHTRTNSDQPKPTQTLHVFPKKSNFNLSQFYPANFLLNIGPTELRYRYIRLSNISEPTNLEWNYPTVRETILYLLREISQSKLSKLCQISQPLISNIVNCKEFKLNKERCLKFGEWYANYQRAKKCWADKCLSMSAQKPGPSLLEPSTSGTTQSATVSTGEQIASETVEERSEARITFHPKEEVPQLKEWFQQNANPPERLLTHYADILNRSLLRAERNKVTVKSLRNWWKNNKQKNRNIRKGRSKNV